MKKFHIACAMAAAIGVATTSAQAADGRGGHGGGHWSGGHGGQAWHGGHFGGGFRGDHFHGRGFRGFGSIYLGAPWYWGNPYYYYDDPAYSYYESPTYYDYPTQVYVEPPEGAAPAAPVPRAQYYCPDTGYYPTVKACPQGWLRVVPNDGTPQ